MFCCNQLVYESALCTTVKKVDICVSGYNLVCAYAPIVQYTNTQSVFVIGKPRVRCVMLIDRRPANTGRPSKSAR
jgi:hypothetical protein